MPKSSARCLAPLIFAAVIVSGIARTQAGPADELVESIYGERQRKAMASRSTDDDLALADEIIQVAQSTSDGPDVIAALCERVYQLCGRRTEGLSRAADAMMLAADHTEDKKGAFLDRAAAAQQRLFTATRGPQRAAIARRLVEILEISAEHYLKTEKWTVAAQYLRRALAAANSARLPSAERLRRSLLETQNRPRLLQKADQLKATLKESRDDKAAANALIQLYLVGLDQPDEARKYSFLSDDKELVEGVRLASTDFDALTDDERVAVGDLYTGLYAKAAPESRHRMLIRAYRAYAAFLDSAKADHTDRVKAELSVKQLRDQLGSMGIDPNRLHRPSDENRIEVAAGALVEYAGHGGDSIGRSTFSPDGKQIATAGDDGTIRLWDAATHRTIETIEAHKGSVHQVVWSADGQWIASVGRDEKLMLWSVSQRKTRATISTRERAYSVAISADGKRIVTGGRGGTLKIWNPAASAKPINCAVPGGEDAGVYSVALSPNGRILAATGTWRGVTLFNATDGSVIAQMEGHWRPVYRLAFSPNGQQLASGGQDGTVRIWNVVTKKSAGYIDRAEIPVHGLAFSPDGRMLAVAREDSTVRLFDFHFRTRAGSFNTAFESASGVAFDPLGQRVLVTGRNAVAKVVPLNRFYKPAGEPIDRPLALEYFWSKSKRFYLYEGGVLSINDDDDHLRQYFFAHADGLYEVRIRAYGQQAGDEAPILNVHLDNAEEPAGSLEIKSTKDEPETFVTAVELKRGGHTLGVHFSNDFYESEEEDRNIHVLSIEVIGVVPPGAAPAEDEKSPEPIPDDS